MRMNILTQCAPYKVMMLFWCFLYLHSVSRFPQNTLLRWGLFVGTRTSRKEGGSPNRETASFLPQESIFPAEPTKTQVRKLWRFALFATLKKMGQRGSCFFSFHLWGNASLNTSRTTALRKATNHDSVVLSFSVSFEFKQERMASLLPDGSYLWKWSLLQTFPVASDIRWTNEHQQACPESLTFSPSQGEPFFWTNPTVYWKWTLFLSVYSAWGSCCQVD